MIEKIRAEGMERSKVLETFDYLATVIGPRLTNSPAHKRAVAWTQEQLKAMGLSDVHAEPFQFGRGWTLNKVTIEMVEPRYMPLIGYPRGWSPSTAGRIVADAGVDAGPRSRRHEGAGRQAEGRDSVHEPDAAVRDSRGSAGRQRRPEAAHRRARPARRSSTPNGSRC